MNRHHHRGSEFNRLISPILGSYEGSGDWVRAVCPMCVTGGWEGTKQNLAISRATGWWSCWRCHLTGVLPKNDLLYQAPVRVEPTPEPRMELPRDYFPLGQGSFVGKPFEAYMLSRGVPIEVCVQASVGAVAFAPPYSQSVIIPVVDRDDELKGFVARSIREKVYRYPKGMGRGNVLFNEKALTVITDDPILLVEGSFDALPYWPHGVALLGKPSHQHLERIVGTHRPVVVAFDADAQEEGWSYTQKLKSHGVKATFVKLPPKTDPNTVHDDFFNEYGVYRYDQG